MNKDEIRKEQRKKTWKKVLNIYWNNHFNFKNKATIVYWGIAIVLVCLISGGNANPLYAILGFAAAQPAVILLDYIFYK